MRTRRIGRFLLLSVLGILFLYPLLWLVSASFKPNQEIFSTIGLIPSRVVWDAYWKGWQGIGRNSFGVFLRNTVVLTAPTVLLTLLSSTLVAYGFARFRFPLKKLFFALLMSSLMLPDAVIMIPRYILFRNLGWLNTYLPFYVPALLGVNAFFIFLLIQFFRGIPRELDEAAVVDGCGSFRILVRVVLPLSLPALVSVCLFQFIWTWNEFFNVLIYINSVAKFPVSLGLRLTLDNEGAVHWNRVMAMSVVAILPCVAVFLAMQRHFVEGITTTGLKG